MKPFPEAPSKKVAGTPPGLELLVLRDQAAIVYLDQAIQLLAAAQTAAPDSIHEQHARPIREALEGLMQDTLMHENELRDRTREALTNATLQRLRHQLGAD